MSAVTSTKSVSLRIILTSARAFDIGIAALGAVALALAFPKANLAWLAPLGAAALFWLWYTSSWKRAFWLGWFAGFVFFGISLSWVGHTVGSYLGAWAPAVVILPALLEGFYLGLTGIAVSIAFQNARRLEASHASRWAARLARWTAPLAAAAAFPIFEWARSTGWLGAPFAQLGYSQADTPLALFAAYIGTYGVTFVVCMIGAYLADAVASKTPRRFVAALCAIAIAWAICWWAWPARQASARTFMRVAVIQANITQSLKWVPGSVPIAIARYVKMTRQTAAFHPELIVWPETVIPEPLNEDPPTEQRFAQLAQQMHATLVVGAQEIRGTGAQKTPAGGIYNALYIFAPSGALENIYEQRQLVPFAESLPAKR
jgi:apolipoprotein N-acyltransferase